MTCRSSRYRFVSPAGQQLDVYGVVADDGVHVKLVNQRTRRHARISRAWLSERPDVGRAHWLAVDVAGVELSEEVDDRGTPITY